MRMFTVMHNDTDLSMHRAMRRRNQPARDIEEDFVHWYDEAVRESLRGNGLHRVFQPRCDLRRLPHLLISKLLHEGDGEDITGTLRASASVRCFADPPRDRDVANSRPAPSGAHRRQIVHFGDVASPASRRIRPASPLPE